MGMMETILFGGLALLAGILAVSLLKKRPVLSALSGVAAAILICLSAYNWRLALIDSGKDPAWLGFERYPFAPVICAVLFLAGVYCAVKSVISLRNR